MQVRFSLTLGFGFGSPGCFVSALERAVDSAGRRCNPKQKPDDREDVSSSELAIEPTTQKQAKNHAKADLEAKG